MLRHDICVEYGLLLDRFIQDVISVDNFQLLFLEQFKKEKRKLDVEVYDLLETLFGDVDSFTRDSALLDEAPDFYLCEKQLLEKVKKAREQLTKLSR
jgi:hypothetical protein